MKNIKEIVGTNNLFRTGTILWRNDEITKYIYMYKSHYDLIIGGILGSIHKSKNWEHVAMSILSPNNRMPTFEEMSALKDMFWNQNEITMQVLPAEKDYVNVNPYVLHLWRNIKSSELEPILYKEILQTNEETQKISTPGFFTTQISGKYKKVIIGGDKWPDWDFIHKTKQQYWGDDETAIVFTLGKEGDLNKDHLVVIWDASTFELPPKDLV